MQALELPWLSSRLLPLEPGYVRSRWAVAHEAVANAVRTVWKEGMVGAESDSRSWLLCVCSLRRRRRWSRFAGDVETKTLERNTVDEDKMEWTALGGGLALKNGRHGPRAAEGRRLQH